MSSLSYPVVTMSIYRLFITTKRSVIGLMTNIHLSYIACVRDARGQKMCML